MDQLLWKDPQEPGMKANVGWHTDRGYWQCCASENMVTAWVPFHDSNEEIGTITMIDGSHTWSAENNSSLNFFDSDLDALEQKIVSGGKPVHKVPMILPTGHVSFHHCRLIHGSGPNQSNRPRRSVAVHLQDDANEYRRFVNPKSGNIAGHYNVEFCRKTDDSQPDFSDPEICPTLFPA
jgi:ectoine hydroxylase-related dioxygenase (phytanoyl-CoA dioxygenase family)